MSYEAFTIVSMAAMFFGLLFQHNQIKNLQHELQVKTAENMIFRKMAQMKKVRH